MLFSERNARMFDISLAFADRMRIRLDLCKAGTEAQCLAMEQVRKVSAYTFDSFWEFRHVIWNANKSVYLENINAKPEDEFVFFGTAQKRRSDIWKTYKHENNEDNTQPFKFIGNFTDARFDAQKHKNKHYSDRNKPKT